MMKRFLPLLLVLSTVLTLPAAAVTATPAEKVQRLERVLLMIENSALDYKGEDVLHKSLEFLFERDPDSYELLVDYLMSRYDKHSTYLPEGTYDVAFPTGESYVGVGVTMTKTDAGVALSEVREDGPAARAGLLPGDLLTAVDGVDATKMTTGQVAELVRGEDGSRVELSVLRAGVPITFTVTRSQVEVPNLEYSDLGGGVWYMRITRFSDAYTYMLNAQARNDMKNAGAQALVLDLRGNPGGEIRMALTFIDHLIDKDGVKYFTLRDREGDDRELFDNNFLSSGNGLSLNKIVILTDHETASAAEIMTAALHDTGYAVTVGETTFGKARGQNHLVFDDGSAAVLTTVQLVPPSGVDYEGKGLAPDVPVENRREGHPASACRRLSFRRLSMGARGQDVTDLQNAMKALGYLEDWYESDVFDGELLGAVNAFLNTVGENPMTYVNARTAGLINARLDDLSRLHVVRDDQLAKAVEIAGTYVK